MRAPSKGVVQMNISTVLVPLDGSKFAECALPYAIDVADKLNAAIELLCVASHRRMLWQWPGEICSEDMVDCFDGGPSEYINATAERVEAASSARVVPMRAPFLRTSRRWTSRAGGWFPASSTATCTTPRPDGPTAVPTRLPTSGTKAGRTARPWPRTAPTPSAGSAPTSAPG